MAGDPFGQVKISRKAYATDAFWLEPREFSKWEAWEDMIQTAAWRDHQRVVGVTAVKVKRGQILASERFLAERWDWSRAKVRRFLTLLEEMERVTVDTSHKAAHVGAIVTLCNYDTYQSKPTSKRPRTSPGRAQDEPKEKAVKKDEADASSSNWVSAAVDLWEEKAGKPNPGRIGKALKPLVERYNEAVVLKVLAFYLDSEDPEYLKVERLAETFVKWGTKAKEASSGTSQRNGKRGAPPTWGYDNATEQFEGFNEPDDDSESIQGRGAA